MTDVIIMRETPGNYKTNQIINNLFFSRIKECYPIENPWERAEYVPELSIIAIYKNIL